MPPFLPCTLLPSVYSVFLCRYIKDTPDANATGHAVVVNGQTGVIVYSYDLKGLPISQGQVQITEDGNFVFLLMEDNVNGGEV